jgi:sporulation repeat domain protein
MEQKKILWVILSVSLFVLIIFGIALFLYSPSRNSATAQAGGETVPYETAGTSAAVDPDLWARDPDRVAGLDRNAPAAAGNIINLNNLNIISTDGQNGQSNGIDVSELTAQAGTAEVSGLPKDLAAQIGIDTTPEQPEVQSTPAKKEAAPQPQTAATVQAQPKPAVEKKVAQASVSIAPKAKASAKPAAPQVQTLYWVQTASLANRINAERARDKLAAQHMKVEIFTKETSAGLTHRVRVGPFTNSTEANYWLNSIKKIEGFEKSYVTEEKVKTNN